MGQTPAARARGQQGNRRLHARWNVYDDHRKRAVVANTAIARELAGWCWPSSTSNPQMSGRRPWW